MSSAQLKAWIESQYPALNVYNQEEFRGKKWLKNILLGRYQEDHGKKATKGQKEEIRRIVNR